MNDLTAPQFVPTAPKTSPPPARVTEPSLASGPGQERPPEWPNWRQQPQGWFAILIARLAITPPRWVLWIVRALPAPRLRWRLVGRYDEVNEVLSRPEVFGVPFAAEMARLADGDDSAGTYFVLGNDDPDQHAQLLCRVMRALPLSDIATRVVPMAFERAAQCIHDAGPTIDAVRDLITNVALHMCVEYFGVPVGDDPEKFAYATFTISGHLFKPPPIEGNEADRAAAYVRYFVDQAIRKEACEPSHSGTVVANLVAHAKGKGSSIGDEDFRTKPLADDDFRRIRAVLMGMIVAFVPTDTMAAGHMLEVLLDHPDWLEQAEEAANTGDDVLLERVLFEALRFMPNNPGPFRLCRKDYVLAEGTPRAKRIEAGSIVWVWSFAAMFDPLRIAEPKKFDKTRPQSDHLHFGFGMHACAGLFIARAHITQCFKALLQKRCGLERASPARLRGGTTVGLDVSSKARSLPKGTTS